MQVCDSTAWQQGERSGPQRAVLGRPTDYTWNMMEADLQKDSFFHHGSTLKPAKHIVAGQSPAALLWPLPVWSVAENRLDLCPDLKTDMEPLSFMRGTSKSQRLRSICSPKLQTKTLAIFTSPASSTSSSPEVSPSSDSKHALVNGLQKIEGGGDDVEVLESTGPTILHEEMSAHSAHVCATQHAQFPDVISVGSNISEVVKRFWPLACIHLYGSRACGLSLSDSDIDFVITGVPAEIGSHASHTSVLAAALEREPWVERVFALNGATVPVIKLQSFLSTCSTDITFSVSRFGGPKQQPNAPLAMGGILCQLTSYFPSMAPLVFVLKQYLRERGLNEAYSGGLPSVCLSCMVAAHLIQNESSQDVDLGNLMMGFLDHYAQLDYSTMGISLQSGYFHRPQDGSALFVEDPLQPGALHNIGKATFAMEQVKAAFWHARCALQGQACGGHACECSAKGDGCRRPALGSTRLSRLLTSREWELAHVFKPLMRPVYREWQP